MSITADEERNLALARQYLEAIEHGEGAEVIARFFHPEIVQEEFPNRLVPAGAQRDRAAMLKGVEQGRRLMASQRYEVVGALATGDQVALEVIWTGTLAVPFGEQLPAGSTIRARFAVFLAFRDGQIVTQRNYDCFEPW
jgi:ketosteroid isomerase-like protein